MHALAGAATILSSVPPLQLLSDLTRLASVAARGKRRSRDVARFLLDRASAVAELQEEIATRSYTPGIGRTFWVRDPKLRLIYALPFRDRVVQHLLMAQTLPFLEPSLAPQSYACRVGKGTHRCLERAAEWTRRRAYVLRLDMRKFFPSIDHAILRRLLQRTTPLPWRWLRDRFLDAPYVGEQVQYHFTGDDLLTPLQRPHGLPIGSLTSQLWANAYLSPLDHLLASHLGLGSFVRYCDDILVFDDDPGRLEDAPRRVNTNPACSNSARVIRGVGQRTSTTETHGYRGAASRLRPLPKHTIGNLDVGFVIVGSQPDSTFPATWEPRTCGRERRQSCGGLAVAGDDNLFAVARSLYDLGEMGLGVADVDGVHERRMESRTIWVKGGEPPVPRLFNHSGQKPRGKPGRERIAR
ncbi:MAG: reverse transcriptase domain-containing protein [Myxococcales bacterium]